MQWGTDTDTDTVYSDQNFQKRCRTRFNSWQIEKLEKIFITKTHYPDSRQIEMLANETGISIPKMQNRRAKWRKNSRLRNFGGLGRVIHNEFVPAPNDNDTINSFQIPKIQSDSIHFLNTKTESIEKEAIDLSITALKASAAALSSYSYPGLYLMPSTTMYEKSAQYKNTGHGESHFSNHMNAFEYVHGSAFASNHTTTMSCAILDSQSPSDRQKEMRERCVYN